jgi:chromosome segregation ATPase
VRAQASDDASVPTLNALLNEVRLLRQAIEHQSALAGRAQLLVGKLSLQDQRVARCQAEAQRLETETSSLADARARTQATLTERRAAGERAKDAEEAAAVQGQVRMLEAQLKQENANLATLEARRVEASQALEAERARYEELNARFDQLERDLAPSRR